jgi:N-acyl-D-amino-acid deacylase
VFDPQTITDRATYQDPHQFSIGVKHVLINGTVVMRDASLTGDKPGKVLKRVRLGA